MAELFFRNALEWAASLRDERPVAPMKPWTATYTGRRTAWIYLPLGTFTLAAVILGLIFAEDTLLFFILCCVPALFVVWVTLVGGLAAAATRITLSDTGIEVSAPTWRGTPLPPIRRISAAWSDVISVRRRTEIYPIGRGGFEVPAWELKTRSGTVVFGGRIVPGLTEAMGEIARRAHVAIIDDGAVGVSPIRALVQGTPDWSHDGDR